MGRGPKPAKSKAAKPPIARKRPKDEGAKVADLEKRLAEALRDKAEATRREVEAQEQQAATAEILRVIASSPTDTQPVFDTIVTSAQRLIGAYSASLLRVVDDELHLVATSSTTLGNEALRAMYPLRLTQAPLLARAIAKREPLVIGDTETDPRITPQARDMARQRGWRSVLQLPLVHHDSVFGVIAVTHAEARAFSRDETELMRTFAHQAVIAIENVRLFNETKEALDRQTATADILRVIASSPTDLQPVLDAVAKTAARLCDAKDATIRLPDGEGLRVEAHFGPIQVTPRVPITRDSVAGRAMIDRQTLHVHDLSAPEYEIEFPAGRATALRDGVKTFLSTPLLREGAAIGVINVRRAEVRPFSERLVALLQTFADQAVIAIENVRLFKELESSNRELRVALEQQTATSEILRVIAASPTDLQPVMNALAESAARLCEAVDAAIHRVEGNVLGIAANYVAIPGLAPLPVIPLPIDRTTVTGRAVIDRLPVHVHDLAEADGAEFPLGRESARRLGHRTTLAVPLLREGAAIGAILIRRREVNPFTDGQIALLQTFADQAVIAIENVRLFKELESRNRDLTATSEILQVISRSPTDVQPVFDMIARNATRLCDGRFGAVFQVRDELIYLVAKENWNEKGFAEAGEVYPVPVDGPGVVADVIREGTVCHMPDLERDPRMLPQFLRIPRALGVRSHLIVPMLRGAGAVGAILVARAETGPYAQSQIDLLQTFADQAVIAIENVRLFKELEVANRELAAASEHKSEFLANMSHELRTPLNAIIGFSEVLAEKMFGELNEKQEEYSKDIHASGQHLLSLINDILDLSKIEAGRMELELTDFDLPTAIENALMLVRERAGRRSLTLHKSVDAGVGQLRADERKIRQVVLNLLSNAIKFTPEGGRIEVAAVSKDGSVEVSISDNGVGIAPVDQERVFEEFRQVGTAEKKAEGTGLGLTLCRKFVELHGGRIWVKSQLGAGSTFTFTIPAIE